MYCYIILIIEPVGLILNKEAVDLMVLEEKGFF